MKITDIEIKSNNVKSAPDRISADGEITASDVKNIFDRLPELIAEKHNALVDYATEKLCSKEEMENAARQAVLNVGADDIARIIYDSDKDGQVDNAKHLDGHDADYFATSEQGVHTYQHTAGMLTGTGTVGRFKATVSETLSAINVNGTECTVVNGTESEIELAENCWYSIIVDGDTVNFKAGGGVSNSKLAIATATEEDVLAGKSFYAGNKELKTGTRSRKYLYKDGEFKNINFAVYNNNNTYPLTVTNANNVLTIAKGLNSKYMTTTPVDVTDYDYVAFKFDSYQSGRLDDSVLEWVFATATAPNTNAWTTGTFNKYAVIPYSFTSGYIVADISTLTGGYYLGFYTANGNKYGLSATVSEIFMGTFDATGGAYGTDFTLATATEADVLSGRTFYGGNSVLKTGANASLIDYRTVFDSCESYTKFAYNENGTQHGDNGTFARTDSNGVFTAKKDCIVQAYYTFTYQTLYTSAIVCSSGCRIIEKVEDTQNTKNYIIEVPAGESVTLTAHGYNYTEWKMKVNTMKGDL